MDTSHIQLRRTQKMRLSKKHTMMLSNCPRSFTMSNALIRAVVNTALASSLGTKLINILEC